MKKVFLALCIFLVLMALLLNNKPILKWSFDSFWNFVVTQFDKEEKERQQKVKNGEIVRGKDTILIWENMYVIGHYYDSNHLDIEVNGISDVILEKVKDYKINKKKLYIVSEEGYAIIDKNNLCRVFITVPEKDFVNGYSFDEEGNKSYYTRYIENEHIQYLSEFDEYTDEEQKTFGTLGDGEHLNTLVTMGTCHFCRTSPLSSIYRYYIRKPIIDIAAIVLLLTHLQQTE